MLQEFRFQWDTKINGQRACTQKIIACQHASNNMLENEYLAHNSNKNYTFKKILTRYVET